MYNLKMVRVNILVLLLDSKKIGINLSEVKEVIKYTKLTPVPKVSKVVSGILNIRGEVWSILDLKYILLKELSNPTYSDSKIIITKYTDLKAGFLIENLLDILEIGASEIKEIKKESKFKDVFFGEIYFKKEIIPVINLKKLLQIEIEEIENINFIEFIE